MPLLGWVGAQGVLPVWADSGIVFRSVSAPTFVLPRSFPDKSPPCLQLAQQPSRTHPQLTDTHTHTTHSRPQSARSNTMDPCTPHSGLFEKPPKTSRLLCPRRARTCRCWPCRPGQSVSAWARASRRHKPPLDIVPLRSSSFQLCLDGALPS